MSIILLAWFSNTFICLFLLVSGCFPSAVLLLAVLHLKWPELGRPVKLVGDITYSMYLLHFPIQLVIILAIARSGIAVNFDSPAILLLFVGIVIGLSIPCYYLFELPAQSFLRSRLTRAAPGKQWAADRSVKSRGGVPGIARRLLGSGRRA